MKKKHRLLVGDSEEWAVDLLRQAAEGHHIELHRAKHGIEAIEMFKTLAPSIVILDTMLPKLDGLRVASKLREMELGRVTPVIITSAIYRGGLEVEQLRQRFGFTDFLEKPFSLQDASSLIGGYLRDDLDVVASDADVIEDGDPIRPATTGETELSPLAVPRLLCDLFDSRKTGVLTVRRGEITKILFFEQGQVTHAQSNSKRDRLGRTLLRTKRITLDEYDRAKRLQIDASGRLPLGAALVRLGVLKESDVVEAVSALILSIVFSVFGWESGHWSFIQTTSVPTAYRRFTFNTPNLVFWGLRQIEGHEDFNRFLPNPRVTVERPKDLARLKDGLHLTYFEEQILELIDGRRRLGEIVALGRLAQVDVGRVLFSLLLLGVLRVRNEAPAQIAPAAETERAFDRKGTLLTTSVARLFSRINLAELSGTFTLQRSGEEATVGFDSGEVVSVRSSREEFRLGDVLLRSGKVTDTAYKRAGEILLTQPNRRIGTVFLELHALSLEELDWALRFQAQAVVLDLFRWREGEYVFVEGAPPEIRITPTETTPNLILEGARSTPAPPGIEGLLRSPETLLVRVWDAERVNAVLKLSSAERRLLASLDGGRRVSEVLALNLIHAEELACVLHGLLALEAVRALSDEAARKAEESRVLFRPAWLDRPVAGGESDHTRRDETGSPVPAGTQEPVGVASLDLGDDEDTPFPPTRDAGLSADRDVKNETNPMAARIALAEENRALRLKLEALQAEYERARSGADPHTPRSSTQSLKKARPGISKESLRDLPQA